MHNEDFSDDNSNNKKLFSRGASIYYLGSMVFIAGIALIILGSALIMFFQLSYSSELQEILYTIIPVATGIVLILLGINLMMKQTKKGYFIVTISIFAVSLAIFLFIRNYPHNWYYPLVGYVFGLYVAGFLLLLGNTFAGSILWIIGNRPDYIEKEEEQARLYTDEEIQRDIEEATKKSVEAAVAELHFDMEAAPDDLLVGKFVSKTPKNVTRVKDKITEVSNLKQTLTPGTTEKWGSIGIDKASLQLANTMNPPKTKKKSIFARIKEKFSNKQSTKNSGQKKEKLNNHNKKN
jgi:hypothetical protein